MLHYLTRPEQGNFETRTQKARQKVQTQIRERGRDSFCSDDFASAWKKFKPAFEGIQHGKCGYCDFDIAGNYYGDVDHYAPKVAYPELAYAWDNYLYACAVCNQIHKQDRFPTAMTAPAGASPAVPLADGAYPLLLHPFDPHTDPAEHLEFDRTGQISARAGSDRGWHTIDVCGLDREQLRGKRAELARAAHARVAELEDCIARDDAVTRERILAAIERMGARRRRFAGMVRAIFSQAMDVPWLDVFPE